MVVDDWGTGCVTDWGTHCKWLSMTGELVKNDRRLLESGCQWLSMPDY